MNRSLLDLQKEPLEIVTANNITRLASIDEYISVDTVHLFTEKFEWDERNEHWQTVTSKRSALFDSTFDYSTKYRDQRTGWCVKITNGKLWVEGSIRHLFDRNQVAPLRIEQWAEMIDEIDSILGFVGVTTKTSDLRVSRVDICYDVELPFPVSQLFGLLSLLKYVKRMDLSSNSAYRKNYLRWENSRRAITFYDKGREVRRDNSFTNFLRCEIRLLRAETAMSCGLGFLNKIRSNELLFAIWQKHMRAVLNAANEIGVLDTSYGDASVYERLRRLLQFGEKDVRIFVEFVAINGGIEEVVAECGGRKGLNQLFKEMLPAPRAARYKKRVSNLLVAARAKESAEDIELISDFLTTWINNPTSGETAA